MICLIFFPFLTALVYLIVRGKGMAAHQTAAGRQARGQQQEAYIKQRGGRASPTERSRRPRRCSTPVRSARPSSTP